MGTDEQEAPASADAADTGPVALLMAKFSNAVDRKKARVIGSLFAPDCLFQPGADPVVGREAVAAFYDGRFNDERRRTRHVWSNLIVRPLSAGRAHYEAVLINYAFEPTVAEDMVQMRVGNVWGVCVGASPGEWQFETHYYERVYALAMPLTAAPLPIKKD